MDNVVRIKRKPRPLRAMYNPAEPYVIERDDEDDGSIRYCVFDHRPDSYRFICSTNDDGGQSPTAKHDAEQIVRGLNLLVRYGMETLPSVTDRTEE